MHLKLHKHPSDEMTPVERKKALAAGQPVDRVPCVPFMDGAKCLLTGISAHALWHDPVKMAEAEIVLFNRYGYDRIVIGPNTRGISEALRGTSADRDKPLLEDLRLLDALEPVRAETDPRIRDFLQGAGLLCEHASQIVPVEMSIGGPFTIAADLRGVEMLMRDCQRHPQEIHRLMRIVTDSQKSCIDAAAGYDTGIAMADPVANPMLIGPKMYETFVWPYTKELTDYMYAKTGRKTSLHMCGKTYKIWPYLRQYTLNELSLDNVVDLGRAADELGSHIPIAGNVDPVGILYGSKKEIQDAVHACIRAGIRSPKGYTLATGCDLPDTVRPEQIDSFMDAARDHIYQ